MTKYCFECGATMNFAIPAGDHLPRHACSKCDYVHYINPKVICGCIPLWQGKILLCRRNIEPRLGYWTIPAGFMEQNETTEQGAARETIEESLATVDIVRLHGVYNIPHISQVYFLYVANIIDGHFGTTPESSEVALFDIEDIPWDDMAFNVVSQALREFITQSQHNQFETVHRTLAKNT